MPAAAKAPALEGLRLLFLCLLLSSLPVVVLAADGASIQARMKHDLDAGKPLVAHVVVALCDNASQGIVPVNPQLGDGDSPRTNLYWGALYGVKTYFTRKAGWQRVPVSKPASGSILERIVFYTTLVRAGEPVDVYVVADAWRGRDIRPAITHYLELSAGLHREQLQIE